jgi:hypothetical protein
VQDGGRFRGVPDGRISLLWSHPFFAGDAVSISGPTTASVNSRVASTFSGNASTGEELYDFASFTPCASTAQAEFKNYSGIYEVPVRGGFSKTVNSVPLTRSTYICAYLQVGAPAGKRPTGPTLATASQLITVS